MTAGAPFCCRWNRALDRYQVALGDVEGHAVELLDLADALARPAEAPADIRRG